MKPGICLIGLGPHAQRIYYKYIQKEVLANNLCFSVLVDLAEKKTEIAEYCNAMSVAPENIFLSEADDQIVPNALDPAIRTSLDNVIRAKKIQYAIISTEPKAHKIYIEYFLKNRIPVLTDKPITAPVGLNYNSNSADQLYMDAEYLCALSKQYKTPLYILAQRRMHPAYQFMFEEVQKIVTEFELPITFFNVYHSDGNWTMPKEFAFRENHPHKYGYGKIMHSGYHFADIVSWIAEINNTLVPDLYIANTTELLRPQTHYRQINGDVLYNRMFETSTAEPQNEEMGEIDSYTAFSFRNGKFPLTKENIVAYGHLDMLQSGFSKRAWYQLPKDTYKGNGRLRHEYINLNVGPVFNVQLHSYQSEEVNKGRKHGVGGQEHLDLYIFRNEKLIGGKSFEVIDFGKQISTKRSESESVYLGQNEFARYTIFQQLIHRQPSSVLIQRQLLTNKIISSIYKSAILGKETIFKV